MLRRTAVQIAKQLGWPLEPSRSGFLPDSVQRWKPFKETNPTLTKIAKQYKCGLISNIDDKLLGQTRRHIPLDFDLVVTAQQVRSYKPDPAHFTECERRIGSKKGWVHVAASYYHDVEPCLKKKIPVIWVNRTKQQLEAGQKKPDAEVGEPQRSGQAARRRLSPRDAGPTDAMRAVALHADVIVFVSDVWQTTCTAVRGGDEGFVIDSPVYPEELRALPDVLEQAGFPVSGLLATHGDWDHLLGRLAFPRRGARLRGVDRRAAGRRARPGPARAARVRRRALRRRPGAAGAGLAAVAARARPAGARRRRRGARARAARRPAGTPPTASPTGCRGRRVLVCGDYLSPVEIPMLSPGGSLAAYRATLERLAGRWPSRPSGSSPVTARRTPAQRALEVLAEDDGYLRAAHVATRPRRRAGGATSAPQKALHAENMAFVRG